MAHFAELDTNNIVTRVVVVSNDICGEDQTAEQNGIDFCRGIWGIDTNWVQTSYSGSMRYHYAGIGYTYDPIADAFIPPSPYPSWILNTTTMIWEAPIPHPAEGAYDWDEENQTWIEIPPIDINIPG